MQGSLKETLQPYIWFPVFCKYVVFFTLLFITAHIKIVFHVTLFPSHAR